MRFVKETFIRASPERVFAFHQLPDAFERLIPPWEKITVIQKADISKIGSRTIVDTKILGPIWKRLIAEHTAYEPPRMFEDTQIKGPFRSWRHRHIVEPRDGGAVLRDEVDFEPPLQIFGPLAAPLAITPRLEKMFAYRHEVTKRWCESG
ncbi:MAG TPA: SRPBCC family protein [Pyrinomonadaceae bacterium]|jgi:ligand-binding SRPBCC domain-containing protein|nr:SRPBCC family protein [Pyrinomonadaceae bacterium]